MSMAGKEQERKSTLETSIFQLCDMDVEDAYFDLTVTCVAKDSEEDKILEGVPPVRVYA